MRSTHGSRRSRSTRAAAIVTASLTLLVLGGFQAVRATPGSGVAGTILARGPFTESVDLKVKARIGGDLGVVQANVTADTVFQLVTVQPDGFTGWHSHPGPAFVTVATGTFTYYDGDDPTCTGIPYAAGESFVDLGQGHVHYARNEGDTVVTLYVMYFDVPAGTSPFVDAADPGICDF